MHVRRVGGRPSPQLDDGGVRAVEDDRRLLVGGRQRRIVHEADLGLLIHDPLRDREVTRQEDRLVVHAATEPDLRPARRARRERGVGAGDRDRGACSGRCRPVRGETAGARRAGVVVGQLQLRVRDHPGDLEPLSLAIGRAPEVCLRARFGGEGRADARDGRAAVGERDGAGERHVEARAGEVAVERPLVGQDLTTDRQVAHGVHGERARAPLALPERSVVRIGREAA